jgi:hypothetical protein
MNPFPLFSSANQILQSCKYNGYEILIFTKKSLAGSSRAYIQSSEHENIFLDAMFLDVHAETFLVRIEDFFFWICTSIIKKVKKAIEGGENNNIIAPNRADRYILGLAGLRAGRPGPHCQPPTRGYRYLRVDNPGLQYRLAVHDSGFRLLEGWLRSAGWCLVRRDQHQRRQKHLGWRDRHTEVHPYHKKYCTEKFDKYQAVFDYSCLFRPCAW